MFFVLTFILVSFNIFYNFNFSFFDSSKVLSVLSNFNQINYTNSDCKKHSKKEITFDKKYFFIKNGENIYKILKNVTLTCDIYKSLSRGTNQSIIAYSLYGTNPRYLKYLKTILKQANEFYKNYTIRIYHDSSLSSKYICHFESIFNNVDFCNVEYIPLGNSLMKKEKFYNFSYIPPQSWRFLSLGDDLIKTVLWRDIDSLFTQREIDAVNEWLLSDKFGHIMRGNQI